MSEQGGSSRLDGLTHGAADWAGLRVLVAGIGPAGFAAADALVERGAVVVVADSREGTAQRERAAILQMLGADVRLGEQAQDATRGMDTAAPDLVIASPGRSGADPLLAPAVAAGLPVWGEADLAWRMRSGGAGRDAPAPWLVVGGASGKTTTVTMLTAMLQAAGLRATAAGDVGRPGGLPLLEAVLHPQPYDVVAVSMAADRLRWSSTVSPQAAVCLNVAPGGPGPLAQPGGLYAATQLACVYTVADPATERLVRDADVVEGCRAIGVTLGVPAVSMFGVVEDVLCDRAFVPQRVTSAAELGTLDDVRTAAGGVLASHHVIDALAAAALARAHGVPPAAVRDGLRGVVPAAHRTARVAEAGGVTWVDDAAAGTPYAAAASLGAFERVVWVAGADSPAAETDAGLQVALDDLVAARAERLRAAVLIGPPGQQLARALARHAPDVPVASVPLAETGTVPGMDAVVARAAELARPGDTVLLAPACAPGPAEGPPDGERRVAEETGDAFVAAVRRRLAAAGGQPT